MLLSCNGFWREAKVATIEQISYRVTSRMFCIYSDLSITLTSGLLL